MTPTKNSVGPRKMRLKLVNFVFNGFPCRAHVEPWSLDRCDGIGEREENWDRCRVWRFVIHDERLVLTVCLEFADISQAGDFDPVRTYPQSVEFWPLEAVGRAIFPEGDEVAIGHFIGFVDARWPDIGDATVLSLRQMRRESRRKYLASREPPLTPEEALAVRHQVSDAWRRTRINEIESDSEAIGAGRSREYHVARREIAKADLAERNAESTGVLRKVLKDRSSRVRELLSVARDLAEQKHAREVLSELVNSAEIIKYYHHVRSKMSKKDADLYDRLMAQTRRPRLVRDFGVEKSRSRAKRRFIQKTVYGMPSFADVARQMGITPRHLNNVLNGYWRVQRERRVRIHGFKDRHPELWGVYIGLKKQLSVNQKPALRFPEPAGGDEDGVEPLESKMLSCDDALQSLRDDVAKEFPADVAERVLEYLGEQEDIIRGQSRER